MKTRAIVSMALVIVAIVFAAVYLILISRGYESGNKAVVAIVSSLTGDLAENGNDTANGAKMALDEATKQKLFGSKEITIEIFDDQGEPKAAVNIAKRICQDKRIIAVIGHLTSGSMIAAAETYSREGMPVIMPVPTNPVITQKGYTNLFRVPPTDNDQAPFLANYLLLKDANAPVAVISDLTTYGQGFARTFRDAFEAGGGNVVFFEGAEAKNRDFRALITKLQAKNPKYVILGATYDMGAPFVRQVKEFGLKVDVLSGDGCYGSQFIKLAGTSAEGMIVSFIAPDRGTSKRTEEFFSEFEKKYGKVVSFAPLGYDAGLVVVRALQECKSLSRHDVIQAISSADFSVEGVTGRIRFGSNGDNENKNLSLYTVRGVKWVLLQ